MKTKRTQIDRAIDSLQAEIDVLQLAITRLRQQQSTAPKRKPRALKPTLMGELMTAVAAGGAVHAQKPGA